MSSFDGWSNCEKWILVVYVPVTPFTPQNPEVLYSCVFSISVFFSISDFFYHLTQFTCHSEYNYSKFVFVFLSYLVLKCPSAVISLKELFHCLFLASNTLTVHSVKVLLVIFNPSKFNPDLLIMYLKLYPNIFLHWCTHCQIFAVTLPCSPLFVCWITKTWTADVQNFVLI